MAMTIEFGNAITQENVFNGDALDTLFLAVVHDRLARRKQAQRIGITRSIPHIADDIDHDFFRRLKTER